ncbi:MAG: hypothetical protein JWQ20_4394, partial [Conexibacter sp.]|nr:hypothetical protein [Conexibacter sp.]
MSDDRTPGPLDFDEVAGEGAPRAGAPAGAGGGG